MHAAAKGHEMVHGRGTAVSRFVASCGLSMAVQLVVAMPMRCCVHARSLMHMDGMYDLCGRPIASCGVHIYIN